MAACALVALVCAGYFALAWYGFDLLDEGYFLTHARRVELGGLPYRDFSTPYTPGVFYLYAWIMDLAGPNMAALRAPAVIGRGVEFLALYFAGRRLMPPFFAALAPALILGIDRAPPQWSIHPGWFATPASLLAVLAIGRFAERGGAGWLVASGVASGIGFAFKQNLAAYGLMAALWFLVVFERFLPAVARPDGGRRESDGGRRTADGWRETADGRGGTADGGWRTVGAAVGRIAIQVAALALLPLTVAVIVRPYFSPLVATLFVVPLAALSMAVAPFVRGGATGRAEVESLPRAGASLGREASFYARPLLVLAGFGAVTLPWLALLVRALDGHVEFLSGFVGNIDPSGYYYPMSPPQTAHLILVGSLLAMPVMVAVLGAMRMWGKLGIGLAAATAGGFLLAGAAYPGSGVPAPAAAMRWLLDGAGAAWGAYRDASPHPTDDLVLWLPTLAFWLALVRLVASARVAARAAPDDSREATRNERPSRSHVGTRPSPNFGLRTSDFGLGLETKNVVDLRRWWYVASGAALLLGQYPRMGYGHIVWSGGMLFVVGADLLHDLYRSLVAHVPRLAASPVARAALCLSLVGLPLAAALPYLQERTDRLEVIYQSLANSAAVAPGDRLLPLDLPGAGYRVWAPADEVNAVQITVIALRESTAPNEPIFAYPAIPGFYFLADRPNATRFNHLFAGMASPADEQEMVRQLEEVRYMVWDDENVYYWVKPEDNAPVVEYIRTHFRQSLVFGPYAFLSRDGTGPPRPKPAR